MELGGGRNPRTRTSINRVSNSLVIKLRNSISKVGLFKLFPLPHLAANHWLVHCLGYRQACHGHVPIYHGARQNPIFRTVFPRPSRAHVAAPVGSLLFPQPSISNRRLLRRRLAISNSGRLATTLWQAVRLLPCQ